MRGVVVRRLNCRLPAGHRLNVVYQTGVIIKHFHHLSADLDGKARKHYSAQDANRLWLHAVILPLTELRQRCCRHLESAASR